MNLRAKSQYCGIGRYDTFVTVREEAEAPASWPQCCTAFKVGLLCCACQMQLVRGFTGEPYRYRYAGGIYGLHVSSTSQHWRPRGQAHVYVYGVQL